MRPVLCALVLCTGCATFPFRRGGQEASAGPQAQESLQATVPAPAEGARSPELPELAVTCDAASLDELPEGRCVAPVEEDDEAEGPVAEEAESREAEAPKEGDLPRYNLDMSDEALAEIWKTRPEVLGCISVGFADEGRLINAVQFPEGEGWRVVNARNTWATPETIDYLTAAVRQVRASYPNAAPLRVNQISAREGGYLPPHKSHQNGRDVDLGFYYRGGDAVRVRARERYIDPALNWELVKALVTKTDVQLILVDRRIQRVLYNYALRKGEDKAWLDSLFRSPKRGALIQHAKRHRDHFHVRFYSPRSQELGRRIAPLLALRPEQNVALHRVRRGDTLGGIARRYNSSVAALRKANNLRKAKLQVSRVLKVPLRGPCTRCPVPPPLSLPPRRLPPGMGTTADGVEMAGAAQEPAASGAAAP